MPRYADVEVGTELPTLEIPVTRADLVRYAGASGDFNVLHWNEQVAQSVGLPNVIAPGIFTLAAAGRSVPGGAPRVSVRGRWSLRCGAGWASFWLFWGRTAPAPSGGGGLRQAGGGAPSRHWAAFATGPAWL